MLNILYHIFLDCVEVRFKYLQTIQHSFDI